MVSEYNFSVNDLTLRYALGIRTGCSNIRELLGHKCSIEWIESQPAVRLEKAAAAS